MFISGACCKSGAGWMMRSSLLSCVRRLGSKSLSMDTISNNNGVMDHFLFLQGQVTHGYGRGSKKLGIPTANLPHFDKELRDNSVQKGVYYGWAKIYGEKGSEVPCVANIGKSPTFEGQENEVNIVEVHVIDHPITKDFYGSFIRVALVGFLRSECKFDSFDELVTQINQDVKDASASCSSANSTVVTKAQEFLSSDFESDPIKLRNKLAMATPQIDEKLPKDSNPKNLKALFGLV